MSKKASIRTTRKRLFASLVGVFLLTGALLTAAQYGGQAPTSSPNRFPWPEGKRGALSLSFDDARPSQIDNGTPLLDRYGVKATFYVSPNSLKQRLEGWKKAVQAGHEIGNHSLVHPCSGNFPWAREKALENYTLQSMEQELRAANQAVEQILGVSPTTFAYPCGQTFVGRGVALTSYIPLVARMFRVGRGWLGEAPNDPGFCDLAQVLAIPMDDIDFEEIKPRVEQAMKDGQWLVLAGHDIAPAGQRQTTRTGMLESLLQYAKDPANGVWVDTIDTVASYISKHRPDQIANVPPYLDPGQPVEVRVEDLLSRMTLEEKVGQLNMPCVYQDELGKDDRSKMDGCRRFAQGTLEPGIGPCGGFFTLANTILHQGARQQAEFFNELQSIAIEKTRLRIPLLQTEEGTHGLMCSGHTIFPEGLALGSSWNPAMMHRVYASIAREARAVGIHQLFTLVIEPNRDPRLGRNQEGYSEDPYLISVLAEAIVRAIQGHDISAPDKAIAGLCHYPGQSQPSGGLERGAMEISERTLREVFLPPWEAGIKRAGALGVMATYPAVDGVPVHASKKILTEILREELGFDGLVLGEGGGISTLIYEGLARDQKQAGQLTLKAGLDVGISYEKGYLQPLVESVREGKACEEDIDRSVRRILRLKIKLGLFENPYVDPERAAREAHTEESQQLALETAREGIVLLKNQGNLLPLARTLKSIAVIGPNADHARNQLGDYTSKTVLQKIVTVLDGIKAKVGVSTRVTYVKGCEVLGDQTQEIEQARQAAKDSEVAVVVVGENEWQTPGKKGTNGEGYDVATLELTGMQEALVKAVYETGTPTVVVLINGRPLSIPWIAEHVPAIVEAWMCGEQGGTAVADVLFGEYNPGGKLPVTVARHAGQLPVYYNHKPSKTFWLQEGWGKPYADLDPHPLFVFGHGLSFTRFDYANLLIENPRIGVSGRVSISVDITNQGDRAGDEVVQLYLRDVLASVSRPVKELKGFERITLKPGERKTVRFTLTPEHLALYDQDMRRVVEPGTFDVMIGSSSEDIRLKGSFEVLD